MDDGYKYKRILRDDELAWVKALATVVIGGQRSIIKRALDNIKKNEVKLVRIEEGALDYAMILSLDANTFY